MIDPVWAGVVGTAVGAVAGSAASLLAPLINWRTEKKRLGVEKDNAKELADHQHTLDLSRIQREAEASELEAKRVWIAQWREGVAEATTNYHDASRRASVHLRPLAGVPWFETLRPHLDETNLQIAVDFLQPVFVEIDEQKSKALSDEITRIARQWHVYE
ncbi:hypothetical protein BH93_11580 [Rhodococcoides fascians A25f]|uniref:hypothetical protein n=1 Tax=Rhodococcoides fascians TaxID=1828 RepID=UPI000566F44E|nr:hypothetical protein [Rhodococcus fascians]QII05927.1 hypothetical protein BH93_11580 [Rhodococcus fascians A25f]